MEKTNVKDIFEITKLGFGAWAIGGASYGNVEEEQASGTLKAYLNAGGNFIDTAQGYAQSEKIIGDFLSENKLTNNVIIATKTFAGSSLDNIAQIETTLNQSLKKLKRDYIDLFYLHSPPEEDEVINKALSVLKELKRQGKIRAIGASIKGVDVTDDTVKLCKKYIDTGDVDAIQLVYSVFRQKNAEIFNYAKENNVAIIGRTSLESGFLTGKFSAGYQFDKDDHRNRWNENKEYIIKEAINLKEIMLNNNWDDSLLSLALRFAIIPEAINSTIVGAKNKTQIDDIIKAFKKGNLNYNTEHYLTENYRDLNDNFNT